MYVGGGGNSGQFCFVFLFRPGLEGLFLRHFFLRFWCVWHQLFSGLLRGSSRSSTALGSTPPTTTTPETLPQILAPVCSLVLFLLCSMWLRKQGTTEWQHFLKIADAVRYLGNNDVKLQHVQVQRCAHGKKTRDGWGFTDEVPMAAAPPSVAATPSMLLHSLWNSPRGRLGGVLAVQANCLG